MYTLLIKRKHSTLCNEGIWLLILSIWPSTVHIPSVATCVMCCHKMVLEGNEQIAEQAPAPVNRFPLLWVIREEMTHETLLLLLCRQLWPGFTEQLTVNWRFSSPNHLVVSDFPGLSLQCCVWRCCYKSPGVIICSPCQFNTVTHPIMFLFVS